MLKNKRPGFVSATTLNSPVVVHTLKEPEHVSKDEVLQFLEKFISDKEQPDSSSNDVNLSAALSQLRRIQRDFKGLPPTMLAESSNSSTTTVNSSGTEETVTKNAIGGTKKTFDE